MSSSVIFTVSFRAENSTQDHITTQRAPLKLWPDDCCLVIRSQHQDKCKEHCACQLFEGLLLDSKGPDGLCVRSFLSLRGLFPNRHHRGPPSLSCSMWNILARPQLGGISYNLLEIDRGRSDSVPSFEKEVKRLECKKSALKGSMLAVMQNTEISILIVEDEPPIQTILFEVLSPKFKCWVVESASSTIRLMESRFFHLAVVDSGLPGMSGISLCRLIVNRSPRTAVVIVSGSTDSQSIDEAMRAGAIEYVTKPFDISHIVAIVERYVKQHLPDSAA